ncbi:PLP-dependent aminotransferase family protein [Phenylobacterium sp.]|uniref:aminotransferase-like domain-containing protein n=1 Tax=Phenylobacterium sp. TaxID=1871053 RepID=UPI0035B17158
MRRTLVEAIAAQRLKPNQQLPASRILAQQLGIARNTVTAVYEDLATRGLLVPVKRRGYFVSGAAPSLPNAVEDAPRPPPPADGVDWSRKLVTEVAAWRNITKEADWQSYPYPFLYGQVDPALFPLAAWRTASRDTLGRAALNWWAADSATGDDELLVDQICRNILPRRGVFARPEEVLVTLGAQEGLYLLSRILVRQGDIIGIENPGYTDTRNIFRLSAGAVRDLPVDDQGVRVGAGFDGVKLAVVTPTCQCPTGFSLSAERRAWLLDWASRTDGLLIEDDFEGEIVADTGATAMKSSDAAGRVIYLGTFSKVIAPGMRLGYMVGPPALIAEARALRRLMHRSAPLNNQRLTALFMVEGYYHGLARQLRSEIQRRREHAVSLLSSGLPELEVVGGLSGSALWLRCPEGLDIRRFEAASRAHGVLFDDGDPFFAAPSERAHIRLGLSTIAYDRIAPGLDALAAALAESS